MALTTAATPSRTPPSPATSAGTTSEPGRRSTSPPTHRSEPGPITRPRLRDAPLAQSASPDRRPGLPQDRGAPPGRLTEAPGRGGGPSGGRGWSDSTSRDGRRSAHAATGRAEPAVPGFEPTPV